MDERELAERVRRACLDAASEAYEDGGVRGLCAEGRWELAREAIRGAAVEPPAERPARIAVADLVRLLDETLPLWRTLKVEVDELAYGSARVTMHGAKDWTRAGGTMAGPAVMALADMAIYAALLGAIGLVPLAVTSDLHVRFLRRPPLDLLHALARVVHLGRRQAVCEVHMWHDDPERPVAIATGTYALPHE